MASADQLRAAEEQKQKLEALKRSYAEIADSSALQDLLGFLDVQYQSNYSLAVSAVDNPHRSATALQRAHAYDNIKSYISEMLT